MLWFDEFAARLDASRPYIINDSKTPSGRVHVGALRGVIIHDVLYRALRARGIAATYLYGVDDYDPLDEIPKGLDDYYRPHLGKPLCDVPAPPGSNATDVAEHYIGEFFGVFDDLGVGAQHYRMRDVYRGGQFNAVIDTILRNADKVREIYYTINQSQRGADWHPFQVRCERCGRIGTTEVVAYDGREVEYYCRPNLVKWAQGCGQHGKVSPFDGNGKLVWKLEWVAKWVAFPVHIEGAGKDHSTAGGSRAISEAVMRALFPSQPPPLNVPYEFFLVDGKKMSSSKGIGAAARDMADFLPPEVLRFVMLRSPPNHPVNFATSEAFMVKLFNDYDRVHQRAYGDDPRARDDRALFEMSEVQHEGLYYDANFQLLLALVQLPRLDVQAEVEKRKGEPLTAVECRHLERRIHAARAWLDNYASEAEKIVLQPALPARAQALTQAQRAFLGRLAQDIENRVAPGTDEEWQALVFDSAHQTDLSSADAFKAIYTVLLGRESGPRAGSLLASLDKEFVTHRFRELA